MPAHIEGQWKPAGSHIWQPLLPPEGPQPIRLVDHGDHLTTTAQVTPAQAARIQAAWLAQKPLVDKPEHYHAFVAPFMHLYHLLRGHG